MKQKWVLYMNPRERGRSRSYRNEGKEWYWSGGFTSTGQPRRTERISLAYHFVTAAAAYDFVHDIEALQEWKVGCRPVYWDAGTPTIN